MSRFKGTVITATYATSKRFPLDSRQLVSLKTDLIDPASWQLSTTQTNNAVYNGMITAVAGDGIYVLNDRTAITADNYAAYQAAVAAGTDVASYFSMWTKIASVETVENLVATVSSAVEAVVADLAKLTERVVANETAIAELEGTVTEMGTLVNEVKATAEAADSKADAAQATADEATGTAETALEQATAAQTAANAAQSEAEAATAAAATNKADIETLRSDVSAAQSDIELLKAGEMGSADNVFCPTVEDLPTEGEANIVYIVEEENALYRWDEDTASYTAVGRDYTEVVVIDGGGAHI